MSTSKDESTRQRYTDPDSDLDDDDDGSGDTDDLGDTDEPGDTDDLNDVLLSKDTINQDR